MNFKQLETFVHVAELGSFSKAALLLDIAQPALSRQVRSLEIDLRETLLLRNGRGVVLTEAGQRLFEHGLNLLQGLAQARADMGAARDAAVGRITIGLPPSVGRQLTLPLIDSFKRRLSQAKLAIVEGFSSHISEWITSGRVDLGLLYNPEAQAGLEITPVIEEALCRVSPVTDAAVQGAAMPLRSLPDWPLIVPERGHAIRKLLETQATCWPASSSTSPGRCRASPPSSIWCAPAMATRCCTPARWPPRTAPTTCAPGPWWPRV